MKQFKAQLAAILKDEQGATAIEYALLVGLISVVIIAAVTTLGGQLNTLFGAVVTALGG
ncbi:MAG: Flp/Fap pilin component [Actinomycetota bacterium]|jgi:pilus assembly protein Flp/PilA